MPRIKDYSKYEKVIKKLRAKNLGLGKCELCYPKEGLQKAIARCDICKRKACDYDLNLGFEGLKIKKILCHECYKKK